MPAPITSRRVVVPAVILLMAASSLLPARYCLYGPPLQNAVMVLVKPLSGRLYSLGERLHDRGRVPVDRTLEQLQEEIRTLEGDVRRLEEENRSLREQMAQVRRVGLTKYRPIFARVVGRTADAGNDALLIESGTRDGLDVGMVVADIGVGGFGGPQLVGRIVQVQPSTAAVSPLTSRGTRLWLELSGEPGHRVPFRAGGPDLLVAENADRGLHVKEGDLARLSDDRPPNAWPAGAQFMLVGVVTLAAPDPNNALWQRIEVRPTRSLMSLSEVMVLAPGPSAGASDNGRSAP